MGAVVIAGGAVQSSAFYQAYIKPEDYIICADSGYGVAVKMGIVPHFVVGDFDSYPEKNIETKDKMWLPVEKDQTDSHAAISFAIEKGYRDILFLGAIGTRLDHTIANIQLLKLGLEQGVNITIADENNELFLIDKQATIPKREGYVLSLLPMTEVKGLTTKGLYFGLENANMNLGNPYGVSNRFTEGKASITIESGLLLVILSKD